MVFCYVLVLLKSSSSEFSIFTIRLIQLLCPGFSGYSLCINTNTPGLGYPVLSQANQCMETVPTYASCCTPLNCYQNVAPARTINKYLHPTLFPIHARFFSFYVTSQSRQDKDLEDVEQYQARERNSGSFTKLIKAISARFVAPV